jgi:hypothetical protein
VLIHVHIEIVSSTFGQLIIITCHYYLYQIDRPGRTPTRTGHARRGRDIQFLGLINRKRCVGSFRNLPISNSTDKSICLVSSNFCFVSIFNISAYKPPFSPVFFGIFDLSGEDVEVKQLFTTEEWEEMKADFQKVMTFKDVDKKEEKLLYDLFDNIEKV